MEDYRELADTLIEQHTHRNEQNDHMDDIFYGRWHLPDGMPDWVQEVQVMDGHDAVQTSARVLSQYKNLRVRVKPIAYSENDKWAEDVKVALKWNLATSMRRSDGNILHELGFSSVQYANPVVQVVYLPYQEKILDAMGRDSKKIKKLKKNGDFLLVSHHSSNVYPSYSMYGLEAVLVVKVQLAKEFKAEWGKLANKVLEKDEEDKELYITSYDLWTYERRIVWGVQGSTNAVVENMGHNGIEIWNDVNELGFIPFAIRRWGNKTSNNSDEWYNPMLKTMYDSGQWDMLNIYASMDGTLAWKRAAMPVGVHTSPTGEKLKLDVTEPVGVVEPGIGGTFTPLPPPSVDNRISSNLADLRGSIWQSTIARSLQSLEFPSGTASSSINQVISAATSSLSPYKTIMEQCLSDIFYIMLCYVRYYGDVYEGASLYGEKDGAAVSIPHNTIEPDAVRIEVVITPDVPLDMQAQINSATLLLREFRVPQAELLEELGYDNPSELWERRAQEDLDNVTMDVETQRAIKELEFEYATKTMEMQAGIQQQVQEQQMQQQQAKEAAAKPITENTGGLGGNPAMGGTPPVQAAPGQVS